MDATEIQSKLGRVREAIGQVIVGMDEAVDTLLVSLLSGGHVLLEGRPGVGKTTLAKTFAQVISGEFKRIQMTPDLMPADVLGVNVFNAQNRTWNLRRGPIFANVVLVDELNRASPKVQSAFLEAMQEKQVTIDGETMEIAPPFMVVATQVPYGEAGTYPLTSVQIDRFTYLVELKYPSNAEELELLSRVDRLEYLKVRPVLSLEEVKDISEQVQSVYVHGRVNDYIISLVTWLRGNRYIRSGPGPRASITLFKGSRVKAMMDGREYVSPDDVKALAVSTLQHRIEVTSQARVEEITGEMLVREALASVPVPKDLGREA